MAPACLAALPALLPGTAVITSMPGLSLRAAPCTLPQGVNDSLVAEMNQLKAQVGRKRRHTCGRPLRLG